MFEIDDMFEIDMLREFFEQRVLTNRYFSSLNSFYLQMLAGLQEERLAQILELSQSQKEIKASLI